MSKPAADGTLPLAVHIGFLEGIQKRDAIARVRGLIRRDVAATDVAYWYILRTGGGYAYEIQEGGPGRAYLPALVKQLASEPDFKVAVQVAGRRVQLGGHAGKPYAVALQDEAHVGEAIGQLAVGPRMRAFEPTYLAAVIVSGVLLAAASVVFLTSSLAINSSRNAFLAHSATPLQNWPAWHYPLQPPAGHYVARVQFSDGRWSLQVSAPTPKVKPGVPASVLAPLASHP